MVATFFASLLAACDGIPCSLGLSFESGDEECRIRDKSGGLLVAIPNAIRLAIEHIGVFELLNRSGFGDVLGYVAFERAGEND